MTEMLQWEYKHIHLGSFWASPKEPAIEAALNTLGLEGWEAVNVYTQYGTNQIGVLLKRPLSPDAARRRQRTWPG